MACNHGLLGVCERIQGNETPRCIDQMVKDRDVAALFFDLLFKHKNILHLKRVWGITLLYGKLRPLPLIYAYLNDVQISGKQRTFRITFTDWQKHTYGVVEVILDIYPELQREGGYRLKKDPRIVHKHTCVMVNATNFGGVTSLTFREQVSNILVECLWLLEQCCVENMYDVVEIRRLMASHGVTLLNSTMFSTRLINVLLYACRLQKTIRTHITRCCPETPAATTCTYCRTCLFVCLTIRDEFPEANLWHDDVVFFTAP
jgi:hypothetical protein